MNILKDFSIAEITNYKIGGKARFVIECQSRDDILQGLEFVGKNNINRLFVLGLGTNVLFSDEYFDGLIIRITHSANPSMSLTPEGYISTFAGETVDALIQYSFQNNSIGLEWAGGLPGTVGGGVRGNAGAFGGEMKDSFYEAEVLQIDNNTFDISKYTHQDMEFSYRNSVIKKDRKHIIVSSTFILSKTDEQQLQHAKQKHNECIEYRMRNHPLEYPNCGSVFKNVAKQEDVNKILEVFPDLKELVDTRWRGKIAMGYMTKRMGFDKYRIGNAMVSEKHGNYIINLGGASFTDVKKIITDIKEKFQETFNFTPETEVEIVE